MADEKAMLANLSRCRDDLEFMAKQCLSLRAKDGATITLELNPAQQELHRQLEAQRAAKGWVRAIVLKGRQQGISTYTAARYYWRASMRRGVNVYILSHEQTASDTLFSIVDRYHRNNPLAPHVGTSNAKELEFDRLDSSYAVATAGAKAGGRSKAISLFHGSEVAFWPNASEHFAASVQGVPLAPGTEIILESTSAGAGGEFYERFQDAQAGRGDYIAVFLPWWLSPEYERTPDFGFVLTTTASDDGGLSELEYAELFMSDLPQQVMLRKMAWRRSKISELRSDVLFRREYPATPAEAWTAPPGHEPFINSLDVLRARKRKGIEGIGPLIIGVDPASNGGDRFSVARRRGMQVSKVEHRNKIDILEAFAWVKMIIDTERPARVNIDAGNIGANLITMLKALGEPYLTVVRGVNFGGTSEAKLAKPKVPGPRNRRAEMWARVRDWLMLPEGASIPDDEALQADLTAPKLKPQLDNDFLLESKEDMKKRGIRSPDLGDSVALTFATNEHFLTYHQPVVERSYGDVAVQPSPMPVVGSWSGSNSWMG
jgi:hypothetical protein